LRIVELIILAALAAVVLFQLYAVLGRRVGRGADETPRAVPATLDAQRVSPLAAEAPASAGGLAAVRARDPNFDVAAFLGGARQAYQMIVTAFAAGDRAALRPLLSEEVMRGFEDAIRQREAEGRTETVDFLQPPRADFEGVNLAGDLAKASVRFLAEFRARTKGPEGEAVDDRRTALIHVDAAEA
jgi:predicted lipid-binding transport protein (Tim44 family)